MPPLERDRIKGAVKATGLWIARLLQGFDRVQLAQCLHKLGLKRGDRILVHSSLDQLFAYDGTPSEIIAILQEIIGEEGIVAMPTLSFSGLAIDFARSGAVFDVRRTPSHTGLLTELFRRSAGVVRSVHPTHSVAVWGRDREAVIRDHWSCATPCGAGTPYLRLAEMGGKVVFLGVGIDTMTYFHGIEEQLEPLMPESPFTDEIFVMQSKDAAGRIVEMRNRLFKPEVSRRRNLHPLKRLLYAQGRWAAARLGGTSFAVVEMREVAAVCRSEAEAGRFFYD